MAGNKSRIQDDEGIASILREAAARVESGKKSPPQCDHFDKAISLLEQARNLIEGDQPVLASILRQLAFAHEQRYKYFSIQGDLSTAITLSKEALQLLPIDHSDYTACLLCVAQCIRARFIYFGKTKDLKYAVTLAQECLQRYPVGHPERAAAVTNLVDTLYAKYDKVQDSNDLDLIVTLQESLVDLHPTGDPLRPQALLDLSRTLVSRFEITNDRNDVDAAISLRKEIVSLSSGDNDSAVTILQDYVSAIWMRYTQYKDASDLDLCISAREEILRYFPPGHPARSKYLRTLINVVHIRADKSPDEFIFAKLVPLYEELMHLLSPDDNSRCRTTTDFADALEARLKLIPHSTSEVMKVISLREEAITLSSPNHPDYASSLCSLADALNGRYETCSGPSDRNRAITLYRDALIYFPEGDPLRFQCLLQAGSSIRGRYLSNRHREDLLEALALFEEASQVKELDADDHIALFLGLSSVMLLRFRDIKFPTAEDFDRLIERGTETMMVCPESHEYRAGVCAMFAQVLQSKFTLSWDPVYLDRALPLYREAISKFPEGHDDWAACSVKMADALKVMHLLYYKEEHLYEAITILEDILQRVSASDSSRAEVLCGLSDALRLRYKYQGHEADIGSALALARDALSCPSLDDQDRARALSAIAQSLFARHRLLGKLSDLDDAISHYEKVVQLRPSNDPFRVDAVGDLGISLMQRYESKGILSDINRAIDLQREAFGSCPRSHPAYTVYLGNLIDMLFSRNRTSGDPGDLEEALIHCRKIIQLQPDDRIQHLIRLSQMMFGLTVRYAQTNDPRDMEQIRGLRAMILEFDTKGEVSFTVDVLKKNAAVLLPRQTQTEKDTRASSDGERAELYTSVEDKVQLMILAADTCASRYEETKDLANFSEAEKTYKEALNLFPEGHRKRFGIVQALSSLFASRYHHLHDTKDLDTAITFAEIAANATLPRTRARAIQESHLGNLLAQRYWDDKTAEGVKQLQVALEHFQVVANTLESPLHVRFHASLFWAAIALEQHFTSIPASHHLITVDPLSAYRTAFTLLPQLAWLGSDTRASLHAIQQSTGLPADAATFALITDHVEEAVEFLEAGRSVIWTQATRLRTPVQEVEAVAPELATRLRLLSRTLEGGVLATTDTMKLATEDELHGETTDENEADVSSNDSRIQTPWQLRQSWLSTIEAIRHIPGFQHFLSTKPFRALASVASEGPVVVLIVHERLSVALVLAEEGSVPVCIPIAAGVQKVKSLHGALRRVAMSRGKDGGEHNEGEDLREAVGIRAGRQRRLPKTESGDSVLSALWTDVAEPVLKYLTDLKRPNLADRKRIWWCTVGPLVFMPIHASSSKSLSVSDFFVSSYTPTLDALLTARSLPVPSQAKVLAAIQPSPGNGWSSLPNTKAELREVHAIVPKENLISLWPTTVEAEAGPMLSGDANVDGADVEGTYTTSQNVLSRLNEASVLHLACHGDQVPSNPLQSGFIMRNGERLTVEMLMKASAGQEGKGSSGGVALLSACHTAGNDIERPDEAINLASVMLFVGYRSVGATMWPMGDPDGPVLTRAVYKSLFDDSGGDLKKFCLARAIDGFTRAMSAKGLPSERWATFIHIGA